MLLGCDTGSCDSENNSVSFCLVSISAYEVWVFVLCCASEELDLMQKYSRKSCFASESVIVCFCLILSPQLEIDELFQREEVDAEPRVSI